MQDKAKLIEAVEYVQTMLIMVQHTVDEALGLILGEEVKSEETVQEKQVETTAETVKEISFEEVRAILAEKAKAGKTAEVKALISSFGGSKLSDIDHKDYAKLLEQVEGI